jgi:hypothetical protein
MNLTAEQNARNKCAELFDPDMVRVRVKTSWHRGFCLPDEDGDGEEWAIFATMTFGDNYAIDKATGYDVEVGDRMNGGGKIMTRVTDINEYKRLVVKRNLLDWSLDIPVERDRTGWMTQESYQRVSRIPAPLLDEFVRKFEESIEVSADEEQQIARQCAILFGKSGNGVTDACEAVSRFCTLGNFSEKFGISRELLPRMPYKEFLMLKIMIGKESEAMRQNAPKSVGGGNTKVIGPGGRARPSRGTKIAMPGSR